MVTGGGGIRGRFELIIIDEIMSRLTYALKSPVDLLPANDSDMVCGTGTGGEASIFLVSQPGIDPYQL